MLRPLCLALGLAAALAAGGCATEVTSNVSTFGHWAADRPPDTYVFERLPSQQTQPEQQRMEDAARSPLEAAGFKPAVDAASASVTVLLGTRLIASDFSPFDDPIWWRSGWTRPRFGHAGFVGVGHDWAFIPDDTLRRYAREVTVLIRDRQSGEVVYETHASSEGALPLTPALMTAMFEAALAPFPGTDVKARSVTTPLAH